MATKKTTEPKKAPEAKKVYATVTGGKLNVRAEASIKSDILRVLEDSTKVEIKKKGNDWCELADGYVMTQFLTF